MTALFANRFLTPLRAKAAAILRFVVILVLVPALCGGCASSARLGAPLPAATGKYRMAEMLPALSNDYWEINPEHRAGFIAEQFPKGMPDDFVSIEGSGAQADIQALRLDPCTVAIVSGTQRHMRFADGDHQIGFTIEILRRTDDGWQDLTPAVFPFPVPPHGNIELNADGTVLVSDEHRKASQKFRFDGERFGKVE